MPGLSLSIGLRMGQRAVEAAAPTITAPALTRTSSAGASPLTWDATNCYADLYARLQVDGNSDFSSPEQDYTVLITASNLADTDLLFPSFTTPSGLYYLRMRFEREDGAVSAWSNTLTDTIVASVAVLFPTTGVHKHTSLAVSGSNLIFTGTDWNAYHGVETTTQGVAQGQFEVLLSTFQTGTVVAIGLGDGTTDFNGGFNIVPGRSNANGVGFDIQQGANAFFFKNSAGTYTDMGAALQAGDYAILRYNRSGGGTTGTLELWRDRSGTVTQIGSQITGLDTTKMLYAYVSPKRNDVGTVNFGATTFRKALAGGYNFYG